MRLLCGVVMGVAAMLSGVARADPTTVLRFATVAPEGSAWAHELHRFAGEVERGTSGQVRVKIYYGSIAGDEDQVAERIRRGQLDGAASGGILCGELASSLRVVSLLGLFQSRDEASYVVGRLKPTIDREFQRHGFTNLGEAGVGPMVIFSRDPIDSMSALRKERLWVWTFDQSFQQQFVAIGASTVPLPIEQAARGYAEGRLDGFVAVPTAALAFQWTGEVKYVLDLRLGFLTGCLAVANRAFDPLSNDTKSVIRNAAARLSLRFEEVGRAQDQALLGRLLASQGVKSTVPSPAFRSTFFDTLHAARDRLQVVPKPLLAHVQELLADYRAEHHSAAP